MIKDGEKKFDSSTDFFGRFFQNSPAGMFVVNGPSLIIQYANAKQLSRWNKSVDNVIGFPLSDVQNAQLAIGLEEAIRQVADTGKPSRLKALAIYPSTGNTKAPVYHEMYAELLDKVAPMAPGILVTLVEVCRETMSVPKSTYPESEISLPAAFRHDPAIYETVINNTPDLYYLFSLDYRFIYANDALLAMWGRDWEYANGRGLLELGYEPWHAELHEREIDEVAQSQTAIRGEVSFPHATLGRRVYDYIFTPVINDAGVVISVAGTTRDITELKRAEAILIESEKRFRDIADQSPMFVFIIEPNDEAKISYWNKTWLDYTGQNLHEALGRAWDGVIHPDDVEKVLETYVPAFKNREPYFIPAVRIKKYDNSYRWHLFKASPRYINTAFAGYAGIGFDIHEQKMAEDALRDSQAQLKELLADLENKVAARTAELAESNRQLESSNDDLQQFAHVASHDLKEPVRKIRVFADRLMSELENNNSPRGKNFVLKIDHAASRMFSMIEGILSFSSMEGIQLSREKVDLNEVMLTIQSDLELVIEQTAAVITTNNLPVIEGSSVLIYQLFYNLVNNSLKFSRVGQSPQIVVSAKITEDGFHQITVTDNGIGFEQSQDKRIFQTFSRLNSKDRYEGTGLGLALCKKIAERHGGTISARGEEGVGAVFTVVLPVH